MADETAASIATNSAAPADERYDAQVAVQRAGLGDLIPREDLQPIIDHIAGNMADGEDMMKGRVITGPWGNDNRRRQTVGGQSVFLDEFQVHGQGQYWDRPGALGFDSMKAMVAQTPILNGIILTRIRQVRRFTRPVVDANGTGFAIQHVDPSVKLSDEQQESIKHLSSFILNGGWEFDARSRKKLKRDTFGQFMAKSVRDALTMDAAPIETEFKRDRRLGIDGFYAVDGSTIRLCTEDGYEGDDEVFAVQVVQGNIRTAYTHDELVYEPRNPRSDVTASGYGYSETEMLIKVVTYLLNTMTYNGTFFDKNSIPRGILHLHGNYDERDLASFRRYWNSMVKGVQNAHNMPVLTSKDHESAANFTEIGGQLQEMAFAKWLSFLTSIACSIYGVAPEEISMESFASQKSGLSGSDTEEKLVSSNDKGLRPLLNHYEDVFSDFIIQPFSDQYCLRFVGLDGDSKDDQLKKREQTFTLNEARKQDGLDPVSGPLGDAPLNPTLMTAWSSERQAALQQEQQDFGDPDADGDDAPGAAGDDQPGDQVGAGDGQPGGPGADPDGADDFSSLDADQADQGGDADDEPLNKAIDFGFPVFRIET